MSSASLPTRAGTTILDQSLYTCLKDPNDFLAQFGQTASSVLANCPPENQTPAMREALVYWNTPTLEEAQKKRILKECAEEVEIVRQYLWNKGWEIFHQRKRQAYENSPWIFRKITDFQNYLDEKPVANRCKVYGTALAISGLVFFCSKFR